MCGIRGFGKTCWINILELSCWEKEHGHSDRYVNYDLTR